ncbi:MAG: hypothetical protein H0T73_06915 [Ardenticatenales bacterium]|nr:hypothetical protein [Ardenticatenales bacterium]
MSIPPYAASEPMNLFIITILPLSTSLEHAPPPVQAIPHFLAAGHRVYLAAPLAGQAEEIREALGVGGVLPLHRVAPSALLPLLLNGYRVGYWARRWRPEIYLSVGPRSALLANGGRGAADGDGISVQVLSSLQPESTHWVGQLLERRAIQEADRLLTYEAAVAGDVVGHYGARGGDVTVLPDKQPRHFVSLCEQFLAEPPGFN